ncbi:MAG: S49 family peptidase [Propionibacteriaceae bacterium]|nr:S49 family peptidase [Propionibacteriaceae bacterium]
MSLKDVLGKIVGDKPVVLELDLARGLLVAKPTNPLQAIQLINSPTLASLREHLAQAAVDDRVVGLIVHAAPTAQVPLANLEEVAGLIEEFGAKKKTMAWAESFGELIQGLAGYRVAAAAQQIWVQPTGMLSIEGLELQLTLMKGLLNKVGVEPQFGQRHEYKTAANQFNADEITEPHREMMERIGQSIVDEVVADIARLRSLTPEQVWDGINSSPVEPERAHELGLIDHIGYRDEAYAHTLKEWGADAENLLFAHRYTSKAALLRKMRPKQPKVAIVSLRGGIVMGRGVRSPGGEQAGADVVDEHLRAALRDEDVKAVVFDIDSPGGSAVASDFIRRSVLRLKEAGKPVVAHMGATAASGGYYVAMPANEIVAQASTLTGSIGVLGGKMVTEGLYDKLGLVRESLTFGAGAGTFSNAHEFSDEDWERLNRWLDRVYLDFTTFAAQDRDMDYDDLERLARGRVWTGADAKERGLVDHIGGQRLAVERACRLAGLHPGTTKVEHVGEAGLFELLKPAASSETMAGGASLPDPEQLLTGLAASMGLVSHGALSMPFAVRLR